MDSVTFSTILASFTMSEVQNGNVAHAAQIFGAATSELYDAVSAEIYMEMMQLLSLEYALSENRIINFCRRRRRRFIDDLEDDWCYQHTRFTWDQLRTVLLHWRVPEFIMYGTDPKHVSCEPGETLLIVSLTVISNESPLYHHFDTTFGGDPRPWGRLMAEFIKIIMSNFYHKISGSSLEMYVQRLRDYAHAVATKVNSQVQYKETVHANGTVTGTYA